jgi:hypothetical protein
VQTASQRCLHHIPERKILYVARFGDKETMHVCESRELQTIVILGCDSKQQAADAFFRFHLHGATDPPTVASVTVYDSSGVCSSFIANIFMSGDDGDWHYTMGPDPHHEESEAVLFDIRQIEDA